MSDAAETTETEKTTEDPEGEAAGAAPVIEEAAAETADPEPEVEEPTAEAAADSEGGGTSDEAAADADGAVEEAPEATGGESDGDESGSEPVDEVPEEYQDAADEAPAEPGVEVEAADIVSLAARTARVFMCECGYKTYSIWSEPTVCRNRPTRHGPECGKQLHRINEGPERAQKALNPLKVSKKRAAGTAS